MIRLTIDGLDYQVESLSEKGQAQLRSLQFTETQLQKLRNEVAVFETARGAYLAALKAEIARAGGAAGQGGRPDTR